MDNQTELRPLLVDAKQAAKLCGCGLSLWYSLNSQGRTPEPVKLNSKTLWKIKQLEIWIDNDCPPRTSNTWKDILERINE